MKILLADDHAFVRKGLYAILFEAYPNAHIEEVTNGVDLLKKAYMHPFDIIISDITMPDKNGIEVLHDLKENKINVPVIILSVHPLEVYALRCIKEGAYAYLNKETTPKLLVEAINHILSTKQKYITPELAMLLAGAFEVDAKQDKHGKLSNRELEIFKLLANGKSGTEIAEALHLSPGTVSTYKQRIFEKMQFENNSDMVRYAVENKLL